MAMVRVEERLRGTVRALAETEHRSIGQAIEDATDRYQKDRFWREMHEGFARLRADPVAWKEYQDEAAAWESVSGDGPDGEAPYFTDEEMKELIHATTPTRSGLGRDVRPSSGV